MLHHTYTLPVNQAGQPSISLEQLWSGLILRIIEQPQFTLGLDSVDMIAQTETDYRRALHFGAHIVHDRVHCVPHQSVEFVTDATDTAPSGRLLINIIHEPVLSLQFAYSTEHQDASSDEEQQLLGIIKSAYVAADTDMIRIIRELSFLTHH